MPALGMLSPTVRAKARLMPAVIPSVAPTRRERSMR